MYPEAFELATTLQLLPINLLLLRSSFLQHLLNRRPNHQSLHPGLRIREILCKIQHVLEDVPNAMLPWDECNVCVSTLVSDEVLATFEIGIEDLRDAANLIDISVNGALYLFRMGRLEPLCCVS